MHRGYIKLWRRLKDSPFWTSDKFSRPQAWVDLIMMANHKDTFFYIRGTRVDVRRGQLALSEVTLADRWKWSRGKVRRFLYELAGKSTPDDLEKNSSKTEQRIEQRKSNLSSLITILNYEQYQGDGTANGTPNRTADGTADGTHLKNEKNEKNEKKKKNGDEIEWEGGIPAWIPQGLWAEFRQSRILLKAPITERTAKGLIFKLTELKEQGQDPVRVLRQSIDRGWRGVFPVKEKGMLVKGESKPDYELERAKLQEQLRKAEEYERYLKGEL